MSDLPRFGQYAATPRKEACPRHPDQPAVAYCKRCNRPTCVQCTVPTEVGSVCVECSKNRSKRSWSPGGLRTSQGQPYVTYGFIGAAVLVYVIGMAWPAINSALGFNPVLAANGEPWRFLTPVLVHGGFFHLLFNMMMLYFIGVVGEATAGHWRFLSIFLLSTMGGSLGVMAWALVDVGSLNVLTVGASGALYGLLGAVFIDQWRSGQDTRAILVLLVVNLAFSFMSAGSVSWQAHIGGLITGTLVAWMYTTLSKPRPGVTQRKQNLWEVAATVGVAAVLVGAAWGIYQALGIPAVL